MLFLWVFGGKVEDSMGHSRFLVFYLFCGVAAALAQAIMSPGSTLPMVGASGAISGVLQAASAALLQSLLDRAQARAVVLITVKEDIFESVVRSWSQARQK
jgi:membrane associated rhomboid family serine protease